MVPKICGEENLGIPATHLGSRDFLQPPYSFVLLHVVTSLYIGAPEFIV